MLDPDPALSDARVENLGDGVLVVELRRAGSPISTARRRRSSGRRASELAGTPLEHAARLDAGPPHHGGEDLTLDTPTAWPHLRDASRVAIQRLGDGPAGYMVLLHDRHRAARRGRPATI
jgi:hypothetical protein